MPTVLNLWGEPGEAVIRAAAPGFEIVTLDGDDPGPADLRVDVIFPRDPRHPVTARYGEIGASWIHLPVTGIDLWPEAPLRGKLVTCSKGVSAIPIAEFVVASILAFEKRYPANWITEPLILPARWGLLDAGELAGRTVGVVGLGGIGTAVAARLAPFDVRVRALRRHADHGAPPGVELAGDLDDLLATADHLVLAAPATAATSRLLDRAAFANVRPGLHLVNVARGSLVDPDALREALDDGRVAMASLDTVDEEPLPEGSWIYTHPQVHLSPHVSWRSPRTEERILAMFADNLTRYVAGEPLTGVVDRAEGY